MQEQNRSVQNFSERIEALAASMGVPLRDLGQHIGISTAMIFAYKSGKQAISNKAWLKLEKSEQALGIRTAKSSVPRSSSSNIIDPTDPKQMSDGEILHQIEMATDALLSDDPYKAYFHAELVIQLGQEFKRRTAAKLAGGITHPEPHASENMA